MNHFIDARYDGDQDNEAYVVAYRRESSESRPTRDQRPTFSRRRGKTPQQFNGIHRRRNKKIRW